MSHSSQEQGHDGPMEGRERHDGRGGRHDGRGGRHDGRGGRHNDNHKLTPVAPEPRGEKQHSKPDNLAPRCVGIAIGLIVGLIIIGVLLKLVGRHKKKQRLIRPTQVKQKCPGIGEPMQEKIPGVFPEKTDFGYDKAIFCDRPFLSPPPPYCVAEPFPPMKKTALPPLKDTAGHRKNMEAMFVIPVTDLGMNQPRLPPPPYPGLGSQMLSPTHK